MGVKPHFPHGLYVVVYYESFISVPRGVPLSTDAERSGEIEEALQNLGLYPVFPRASPQLAYASWRSPRGELPCSLAPELFSEYPD